ncbi:hypothetical protein CQW44_26975 [Streptomyces griseofuscus]|uniref:Uncharacterized protein n=2 Tax=Streptomyces griseofuscus TaxID=146922 RepID=A0A3R8Q7R8_9ACTN|nr:hypothetical protein CQW44_26975 [Streptomyces griseofuscus]
MIGAGQVPYVAWVLGGDLLETARIFFGLAAALVVPFGLDWYRSRPGPAALTVLLWSAYTVFPYVDRVRPWFALCAAVLAASGAMLLQRSGDPWRPGFWDVRFWDSGPRATSRRFGLAAVMAALLLSACTAGGRATSLLLELLRSDRAAVFISALLVAVFGGGTLAKTATAPVRREIAALEEGPQRSAAMEFMNGGPFIGMLERGLLFAFLAAGQPEAAALVLAAKSLARVPSAEHGKHASEYFLIGTLASVIAALAMSMAARSAVGMPVL